MGRETEFRFAVTARRLGYITKDQLVECALEWFADLRKDGGAEPRRPETILFDMGAMDREGLGAVLKSMKKGESAIDGQSRVALLKLNPPAAVRQWIFQLPEMARGQTIRRRATQTTRYELGEEIARGGVGKVVEAMDKKLRREVAIKIVREGAEAEAVERFLREARLTAMLDHPNVVAVHDFGELPGTGRRQFFISMKRIRGRDLGEVVRRLAEGRSRDTAVWSRRRLLQVFVDVCHGVAYAHSRGVLHRDLKPANVMIGDMGEVMIVDWGLAKLTGEKDVAPGRAGKAAQGLPPDLDGLTMQGQVVGTPSYMAPEQAAGSAADMDERSDVYGLGTILYALLTGHAPFEGKDVPEILARVKSGKFPRPSERAREPVAPELEAVCLRAMALNPADRHASAADLLRDVQTFLEGAGERARVDRESGEHFGRAQAALAGAAENAAAVAKLAAEIATLEESIRPHQPVADKKPLWDARARLKSAEAARADALASAETELRETLRFDPARADARNLLADLLVDRFLAAESRGDRETAALSRAHLASVDTSGERRYRLDAPGRLALRTYMYGCACLRPVRDPGFAIEFVKSSAVAWRDGRPRPDCAVGPRDLPVPAMWAQGKRRHGHGPECPRVELTGVEVWIARYVEQDRRLVAGPLRKLGVTPLEPTELPQGSYRCTLRAKGMPDVLLPVRIAREATWSQDVTVYAANDIPVGFLYVPGGPFLSGEALLPKETRDLFVARTPVTCAEYLEFLNALRPEDAERRRPKEAERKFWIRDDAGRFRLPDDDPEYAWRPDWPVLAVTWADALAYCEWRSARDGRALRILHEDEHEKAARGADGREYPFGREIDGTFCHTNVSLEGAASPRPVASFDLDESPFAIRDLAGGASTWCLNLADPSVAMVRAARGGSWGAPPELARAAHRQALHPGTASVWMGFRLCCGAEAWP